MGALFAWISVIEIAHIIFNERQSQIFIACIYVLPFLINIFCVIFPPFVSKTLGSKTAIFEITHRIGVAISVFC